MVFILSLQVKQVKEITLLLILFSLAFSIQMPLLEAHGPWTCPHCGATFSRKYDDKATWTEGTTQVIYYKWVDKKTGKTDYDHKHYVYAAKSISIEPRIQIEVNTELISKLRQLGWQLMVFKGFWDKFTVNKEVAYVS